MPDTTKEFFQDLGRRGHEPFLRNASGTIRFDLADGDRVETWYVTVKKGDIAVSRKNSEADVVVTCDKSTLDGMLRGEVNAMAAALRGVLVAQGDLGLLLSVARLFRGAHDARKGAPAAGYARRMS